METKWTSVVTASVLIVTAGVFYYRNALRFSGNVSAVVVEKQGLRDSPINSNDSDSVLGLTNSDIHEKIESSKSGVGSSGVKPQKVGVPGSIDPTKEGAAGRDLTGAGEVDLNALSKVATAAQGRSGHSLVSKGNDGFLHSFILESADGVDNVVDIKIAPAHGDESASKNKSETLPGTVEITLSRPDGYIMAAVKTDQEGRASSIPDRKAIQIVNEESQFWQQRIAVSAEQSPGLYVIGPGGSACAYAPDSMTVRIVSPALDNNGATKVTVRTLTGGSADLLPLTETGMHTGIFEGHLMLTMDRDAFPNATYVGSDGIYFGANIPDAGGEVTADVCNHSKEQ